MSNIFEKTKSVLIKANVKMKHQYNKKRRPSPKYWKGDKVLLDARDIRTQQPTKKFDDKYLGPFVIKDIVGEGAMKLKLPNSWKIRPVFPVIKI
jgi:hypothetical protein